MWLAVDSGNTRVKWALMEDIGAARMEHTARVVRAGAVAKRRVELPSPAEARGAVWLSHVGTDADLQRVRAALGKRRVRQVKSRAAAVGVVNNYMPPVSLGVDRWLCLLAAHQRGVNRRAGAVVVSAGTAMTVDILSSAGEFCGGYILPGLAAMVRALNRATPLPALQGATAQDDELPRNTEAAISSGAVLAAVGAIGAARRRHAPGARLLLTGGDAPLLARHFSSAIIEPHLLFHGIACLRAVDGNA